ncbi:hypothetical protein ACIF8T_21585 [Streptomyces sp. NPDC085946]|uniref:hypothetical protein n=1 Tax=Streptomyces sp. NPDC085946 TaxID=3365744 RepID=UPI0037D84FEA
MTARDELYNYADDAHLGGDYLDELLDRVEKEAAATAYIKAAEVLRERARELSQLAEEKMSRTLEERAQEWNEGAEKVARLASRRTP